VNPLINDLSDHEVQIITFSNILISIPRHAFSYIGKLIVTKLVNSHFCQATKTGKMVFLKKSQYNFTSESSMQVFQLLNHKTPINQNHG